MANTSSKHRLNRKICKTLPKQNFERHSRKCVICRHPDRAAIEEEFVHWGNPWEIARVYNLGEYRAVYRHAHASGLTLRRRENLHSALDMLIENTRQATVSGDCIIRAIRAYSCVDAMGRWVDPPTQVNFSTVAAAAPAIPARTVISAKALPPAKRSPQLSSVVDVDVDVDVDANDSEAESKLQADSEVEPDAEPELETDCELEVEPELETEPDPLALPVSVAESGVLTHYLLVQPAASHRRDGRTVAQIYGDAFRPGVNSLKR